MTTYNYYKQKLCNILNFQPRYISVIHQPNVLSNLQQLFRLKGVIDAGEHKGREY